jgi:hypothetical protein
LPEVIFWEPIYIDRPPSVKRKSDNKRTPKGPGHGVVDFGDGLQGFLPMNRRLPDDRDVKRGVTIPPPRNGMDEGVTDFIISQQGLSFIELRSGNFLTKCYALSTL